MKRDRNTRLSTDLAANAVIDTGADELPEEEPSEEIIDTGMEEEVFEVVEETTDSEV
jgi:hypothetical protein